VGALAGCNLIPTYEPYVLKAEKIVKDVYFPQTYCAYGCNPQTQEIVGRQWRCDEIPNKDKEREGWVTVVIDYRVKCGF
jgi:hypothetical protein